MEPLVKQIKEWSQARLVMPKTEKKSFTLLFHQAIQGVLTHKNTLNTLQRQLSKNGNKLKTWPKQYQFKQQPPSHTQRPKSFLSLSLDERARAIKLKNRATPVLDNADKLKQAAIALSKAIVTAQQAQASPLPPPTTAEEALLIELRMLTEKSPSIGLMLAIKTADTVCEQIRHHSYSLTEEVASATVHAEFSITVHQYAAQLMENANALNNMVEQIKIDFEQKNSLSSIEAVETNARHIKSALSNELKTVSGATPKSSYPWLRKLSNAFEIHRQGISSITGKVGNKYILYGKNTISPAPIHQVILPLLNEVEKLRVACESIEMLAKSLSSQDNIEQAIDKIKYLSFDNINRSKDKIQKILVETNNRIYLQRIKQSGSPALFNNVLETIITALLEIGEKLKAVAWLVSWNKTDPEIERCVLSIRHALRHIKKNIKDAVETATGLRPHLNCREGMVAKDPAEWLIEIKKMSRQAYRLAQTPHINRR